MQEAMQLTLATSQVLSVMLSAPAEAQVLAQIATGMKEAEARANVDADRLARTYHLGATPTAGKDYDDRLTMRAGFGATKLREHINHWKKHGGKKGGLRHRQEGTKYIVTEKAIREFLGD